MLRRRGLDLDASPLLPWEPYASYPFESGTSHRPPSRTDRYNPPAGASLQITLFAAWPMTSEQAAQLIDDILDLVL
jgi:hypothetical protein